MEEVWSAVHTARHKPTAGSKTVKKMSTAPCIMCDLSTVVCAVDCVQNSAVDAQWCIQHIAQRVWE